MHMGELSEFITYIKFHHNSSIVLCAWIECIHHNILKNQDVLERWEALTCETSCITCIAVSF